MIRRLAWLLVLGLLASCAGCGSRSLREEPVDVAAEQPARGRVVHVVEPGQTLWRIARAYGVSQESIAEANDIADITQIRAGQRLVIPGATQVLEVPPAPAPLEATPRVRPPPGVEVSPEGWRWPAEGPITSRFGARRRHGRHRGIDIALPHGTPIRAAADGVVTFAGRRGDYGKLVVLAHPRGFSTWYAHNSRLLVRSGQRVSRGERIAASGSSGNASGPHLHFEIRREGRALDPIALLP